MSAWVRIRVVPCRLLRSCIAIGVRVEKGGPHWVHIRVFVPRKRFRRLVSGLDQKVKFIVVGQVRRYCCSPTIPLFRVPPAPSPSRFAFLTPLSSRLRSCESGTRPLHTASYCADRTALRTTAPWAAAAQSSPSTALAYHHPVLVIFLNQVSVEQVSERHLARTPEAKRNGRGSC